MDERRDDPKDWEVVLSIGAILCAVLLIVYGAVIALVLLVALLFGGS